MGNEGKEHPFGVFRTRPGTCLRLVYNGNWFLIGDAPLIWLLEIRKQAMQASIESIKDALGCLKRVLRIPYPSSTSEHKPHETVLEGFLYYELSRH